MLKPNRRLAWLILGAWAVLGAGAGARAGDAAARLTGQGGTSVHAEAAVAATVLERSFRRPLGDVFAVTVESPEPVTAPRPAAALDSLAATLRRMPGVRGVVKPPADTGPIRVLLVSRDGRSTALLVASTRPTRGSTRWSSPSGRRSGRRWPGSPTGHAIACWSPAAPRSIATSGC